MRCLQFVALVSSMVIGFILLVTVEGKSSHSLYCFEAKRCEHSHKQKCAANKQGIFKRFWDSCDMTKYNCNEYENFSKVNMELCEKVPHLKKRFLQPWEYFVYPTEPATTTIKITCKMINADLLQRTIYPPGLLEVMTKYWCWQGKHCNRAINLICGRDNRMVYEIFESECHMSKLNCAAGRDYRKTRINIEECQGLITYNLPKRIEDLIKSGGTTSTISPYDIDYLEIKSPLTKTFQDLV